jgi:hypothetical protein
VRSGNLAASSGNLAACCGNLAASSGNLAASSGNLAVRSGNLAASSGNLAASSGNLATSSGNLAACSGNLAATCGNLAASSGNLAASFGNLAKISGRVVEDFGALWQGFFEYGACCGGGTAHFPSGNEWPAGNVYVRRPLFIICYSLFISKKNVPLRADGVSVLFIYLFSSIIDYDFSFSISIRFYGGGSAGLFAVRRTPALACRSA